MTLARQINLYIDYGLTISYYNLEPKLMLTTFRLFYFYSDFLYQSKSYSQSLSSVGVGGTRKKKGKVKEKGKGKGRKKKEKGKGKGNIPG